MRILARTCLTLLLVSVSLPLFAASPPIPSPDQAATRLRVAQARVSARTAKATLVVESEHRSTIRYSDRPGTRELLTLALDPARLATRPRPDLSSPEMRVHWGEYLWTGRVESFDQGVGDEPVSLLDPERYRLTRTLPTTARGRDALDLVFESLDATDRVRVTVDRETFEPRRVEHLRLQPAALKGGALEDGPGEGVRVEGYRLVLWLTARGGYWLVTQGEESYRLATDAGNRQVRHAWKALHWQTQERGPSKQGIELARVADPS